MLTFGAGRNDTNAEVLSGEATPTLGAMVEALQVEVRRQIRSEIDRAADASIGKIIVALAVLGAGGITIMLLLMRLLLPELCG